MSRFRAGCLAAAVAITLAYANHFRNSFHFDDSHAVESNLFIRDLRNIPRFFTDVRTFSSLPSNQSYRPVVTTTLAVDYALGGLDPLPFHVDSFAWFLLECLLLAALFRRILNSDRGALFGAALVGLHPANAETVNYVIARSDVLSALGAVACVWLWAASERARRLHLYLVPAVLGVLAKSQGAMAAPLLFLYIGLIEQRRSLRELLAPRALWQALRPALPAFFACGAALLLELKMAPSWVAGGGSRLHYLLTQPWVVLHYLGMFVLPVGLSADSDWTALESATDPRVFAGLLFLVLALWVVARTSRSDATRPIAYGLLWFFVALLPTSSVIPLAEVMNDHRMHFALPGLSLAAACAFQLAVERIAVSPAVRAGAMASAALLLAAYGFGTHRRNQVWRSEETLWRDVTEKSPGNGRGWMNYGLTRMARGDYAEAERAYLRGLELAPGYGYLHVNMGILKGAMGDPAEAERRFLRGLELMPRVPSIRFFFARWLDQVGRSDEAVSMLRETIALSPGEPGAHDLLLRILARRERWGELETTARETLAVRSNDATALSMLQLARERLSAAPSIDALLAESVVLYRERKYEEMLRVCDAAVVRRPESAEAWNNRCSALNALHRYAEAESACGKALQLKPDFTLAQNNLAVSRAGLK